MSDNKHNKNDRDFDKIISKLREAPELKDPGGLTNSIIDRINTGERKHTIDRTIRILQRVLAAASICLIIVFGVEQYIFVDKVIKMENKNSAVAKQNVRLKGLNFMLNNIDIEKLMMAEKENEHTAKDKSFIKSRLQKARLLALNGNKVLNPQN